MEITKPLEDACTRYIQALYRAKQTAENDDESLDNLACADWIACVPLEHVFCNFPPFTAFEEFAIVNVAEDSTDTLEQLLSRFRSVLSANFGVNFMPHAEVRDSYLWLGDHYYQKSGNYIPGRPLLVARIGQGEARSNERLLPALLGNQISLISLCQIAYKIENPWGTIGVNECLLPTGNRLQPGLIEIPSVGVAINVRSGQAGWWSTSVTLYEKQDARYKPERFISIWREIAVPILDARSAGLSGAVREAIDNSIKLVAKCRHSAMGDQTLNCIIATETILNPFNAMGDTSERFAIFAASLTEQTPDKRLEAYHAARNLYRLRSRAVHQSRLHGEEDVVKARTLAFNLFLRCLRAIAEWVQVTLRKGSSCDLDEFKRFYASTVFSLKDEQK